MLELRVNGAAHQVDVAGRRKLLGILRDDLGLTGSKYGCGEGQCGACTVLVDGVAAKSCVAVASALAGREITTIEGLATGDKLHPVQQAFIDHDAMQCGYCTPGMVMAGAALVENNREPSDEQIVEAMQGNICRCGTYQRIVAALRQAAAAPTGAGDRQEAAS
ncbi:MAG: (2Fe-2S)-binding protein [Planctomycetota bacterium]|nr:MAG: (2Fe-2S)-binding protein [Planctomycetota bacterium]